MTIAANLSAIRDRIARAAQRSARNADDVALMAVTKTNPAEKILEAYAAGQRLFGENRVQEFAGKFPALQHLRDAEFHMIGHLQSNKSGRVVDLFHAVDSVDSSKLAARLNTAGEEAGKTLDVLIEINIGDESNKSGVAPNSPELENLLLGAAEWKHLRFCGLMTVPPFADDPEEARPYFRHLRELRDRLAARNFAAVELDQLSMGMSHDFEVAIEEGSTCVRIGTAIFGTRAKP